MKLGGWVEEALETYLAASGRVLEPAPVEPHEPEEELIPPTPVRKPY